jgi:hypothetical protein
MLSATVCVWYLKLLSIQFEKRPMFCRLHLPPICYGFAKSPALAVLIKPHNQGHLNLQDFKECIVRPSNGLEMGCRKPPDRVNASNVVLADRKICKALSNGKHTRNRVR